MQQRFKQFTTLVASINRSIRRIKTEEMSRYGLKSIHVSCIYYLYTESSLTVKALCDICEEDKANVSRAIEYLEEMEYIERRTEPSKRYKTPLKLTARGKEIGEYLSGRISNILAEASYGLDEAQRDGMYYCLERISENLLSVCDKYDE